MKRFFTSLLALFFICSNTLWAQTISNTTNPDWTSNGDWTGTAPQFSTTQSATLAHNSTVSTSIEVNSGHTLTINSGVTLTTSEDLTVMEGGNLVVNGNLIGTGGKSLIIKKNSFLTIGSTGSVDWSGDVTIEKELTGTIDGTFDIGGNLTIKKVGSLSIGGLVSVAANTTIEKENIITGAGAICSDGTVDVKKDSDIFGCTLEGSGCCSGTPCCMGAIPTLPVELADFKIELHEDGVEVSWITTSEENNDYFEIERSHDGVEWKTIEILDGAGTSTQQNYYMYVDANPFSGQNYYRIKQTDFNGDSETFEIKSINIDANNDFSMKIHGNPVNVGDNIFLHFGGVYKEHVLHVTVFDLNGKEVQADVIEVEEYHGIHVATEIEHNLLPGTYIVKAINGNNVTGHKLIIR